MPLVGEEVEDGKILLLHPLMEDQVGVEQTGLQLLQAALGLSRLSPEIQELLDLEIMATPRLLLRMLAAVVAAQDPQGGWPDLEIWMAERDATIPHFLEPLSVTRGGLLVVEGQETTETRVIIQLTQGLATAERAKKVVQEEVLWR